MSLPDVDQQLGILYTHDQNWRLLNRPLPDNLFDHYEALPAESHQPCSSAPWWHHQCQWELRDNRLYLTELFRPGLLEILTDQKELLATWTDKLILHRATEIPLDVNKCADGSAYRLHVTRYEFTQARLTGQKLYVTSRNIIKGVFGCEDW